MTTTLDTGAPDNPHEPARLAMTAGPARPDHGKQAADPSNGADLCDPRATPSTPYDRPVAADPRATTPTTRCRRYPPVEFGPALAAARARAAWSLADLAGRCGLSRGYLCRLEHGLRAPSVVTAARLVDVLPLSPAEADVVVRAGLPGVGRDWRPTPPLSQDPLSPTPNGGPVTDHRPGKERNMLDTISQCWGGRT